VASKIDIVQITKRYKGETHGFFLDLKAWRRFKSRYKLEWQKVQFGGGATVPQEPGIYVFTVELTASKLPAHGYIMYVGITGDGQSLATLASRYSQYVRHEINGDGRLKVLYMLKNWSDDLWFNFATFKDPNIDLGKLEQDMLNAVQPPINQRDFEAEIAAARRAAF